MADPAPPPGFKVDPDPPKGFKIDQPSAAADPPVQSSGDPSLGPVEAFEQGAVLDPLESVGQMAENLPDWAGGGLARRAGAAIMSHPGIRKYLEESKAGAEAHPGYRMAGGILPWMFVPGAGETALARGAADVGIGAVSSALQPADDPSDPNFWTNKARQSGEGGLLGGAFGLAGRYIAGGLQRAAQLTAASTKATRDAIAANVKAAGETNLANKAGLAAHAQATMDAAKATAKAAADHHTAIANQASALSGHLDNIVKTTTANAAKQQQYAADHGDYILNEARLQTEYAQKKAAFDAEMLARNQLNQQENVAWMRRALDKVGLGASTPTTAGDEALAATRTMIGGKLNEANAQLSFNPGAADAINRLREIGKNLTRNEGEGVLQGLSDKQNFAQLMRNRVLSPIANPLRNDEGAIVGWKPKEELTGQQFANYVSMLNQEADNLARSARFPGRDTENQLKMAQALHDMVDVIEDGAEGPEEAKTLRDKARDAYRTYSTLSSAADPTKLSIAEPVNAVRQVQRRLGTADRYRATLTDPAARAHDDAQHARSWLQQSMSDKPLEPKAPKPGKPPKEPTLETLPSAPKAATTQVKAPKVTKPPEPFVPAQPKQVPVPPVPTPPSFGNAARMATHAALHHLGMGRLAAPLAHVAGHAAARPGPVSRALRSTGRELGRNVQALGSRPGVAARSPDIVIQSITSGSGDNDASEGF